MLAALKALPEETEADKLRFIIEVVEHSPRGIKLKTVFANPD